MQSYRMHMYRRWKIRERKFSKIPNAPKARDINSHSANNILWRVNHQFNWQHCLEISKCLRLPQSATVKEIFKWWCLIQFERNKCMIYHINFCIKYYMYLYYIIFIWIFFYLYCIMFYLYYRVYIFFLFVFYILHLYCILFYLYYIFFICIL